MEKDFIEIIKSNERLIYKVCYIYASPELPLADLYQEIVCNLWRGYKKFRGDCQLSTWIYRIAINTCITQVRVNKKKAAKHTSVESIADVLPSQEDWSEEIQEIYSLIKKLKTMDKTILLLHLEGNAYGEIANITGLSPTNVGVKLMRIKEKLKQMYNN